MKFKIIAVAALATLAGSVYADSGLVKLNVVQELVEHVDRMPESHVQTKSAMCTASANPASGKAGQNVTASGYVSYVITNNTSSTQNYSMDEYMCINGFGCTHVRNSTSLGAHLTGQGGGAISTTQYMSSKGNYVDQSSIQVSGESTCFVQGSNTVSIN